GLFAGENLRTRQTCSRVARQSARVQDRWLVEGRQDRRALVSIAARERRFWKSRSEIRIHEPADLHRRMLERDFLAPEKGIRHAAEPRSRRDCATQSDARIDEARPREFAEPGKTLREAGDRFGALD